jgi:isopentenyl-diphosphate delta-isomerase
MKIVVVDEMDNPIGVEEREIVDKKKSWYRVSALWIVNSKGEILLARRAYSKKHHPGKWGPAVAGIVEEGETYEDNIVKEAEEELGISHIKLELGPKTKTEDFHKHFTQWFVGCLDWQESEFTISEDEVAEIKWFSQTKLQEALKNDPDEFLSGMKKYSELFRGYSVKP